MAERYCEEYKEFLNRAKTETETVREVLRAASAKGFQKFERNPAHDYMPGEKWIQTIRGKGVVLCVIGRQKLDRGCKMAAAHIDSPHLDLKPVPVEECSGISYLKTHYYGKIKKYQWTCIPLALHGICADSQGRGHSMVIGEDPEDPVFGISDLLPHLSEGQMAQSMGEGIHGEQLRLLAGLGGGKSPAADVLQERYGLSEKVFMTAEIKAVPAGKASDLGIDRSMILAYGQDDRVCVYGAVRALLDLQEVPEYTSFVFLADKEEVGSESSAGMYSEAFQEMISAVAESQGANLYEVMAKAECLCADVICAYDPMFPEVTDEKNTAKLGNGMVLVRYTGRGGKKGNSEASASFLGKIAGILNREQVLWQCGELGAVDAGGGTTVAKCIARWGVEILDVGVGLLNMHAPLEVAAKKDIWNFYQGMKAFFTDRQKHSCDEVLY